MLLNVKISHLVSQEIFTLKVFVVQFISILDGTGTFGCGTASESKTIGCTELMSKKTCYCEADLCNGAQKNFRLIGLLIPLGVITIIIILK